ncbi:MAG TPA: hypothetical protein VM554_06240 [Acidisarcina sp.]|nr:hypothetical protein [Acidisarcina sp.]
MEESGQGEDQGKDEGEAEAMPGKRIWKHLVLTEVRMRFLGALALLMVFFLALTAVYLYEWRRHGDAHAEAMGSLLTFFAAIITAAVTLVYLHLTRRSLAAAEAATQLQREQWQMRITVKPRFWIVRQALDPAAKVRDKTVTYRKDMATRYRKESSHGSYYYDSMNWPFYAVDVWNDGERSMRISSYRLWVRDEESISITRPVVGFVIPPNELRSFPITEEMIALVFRGRTFMERYERMPCKETVIGLRLLYSDWRGDDHSSHDEYYLVIASEESHEVSVERMEYRH